MQAEAYDELKVDLDELVFGAGLERSDSLGELIRSDLWKWLTDWHDLPTLATPGGVDAFVGAYANQAGATDSESLVVDKGTATTVNHYATGSDIATSPDINGHSDSDTPDVGAFVHA